MTDPQATGTRSPDTAAKSPPPGDLSSSDLSESAFSERPGDQLGDLDLGNLEDLGGLETPSAAGADLGTLDVGAVGSRGDGLLSGSRLATPAASPAAAKPTASPSSVRSNLTPIILGLAAGGGLLVILLCGMLGLFAFSFTRGSSEFSATVVADRPKAAPTGADPTAENTSGALAASAVELTNRLEDVKAATVFVQVATGGQGTTNGAGFVLQKPSGARFVITNSQVVGSAGSKRFNCIFGLGGGTRFSSFAELDGVDEDTQIAVLRIEKGNLPAPVLWNNNLKPTADVPVLTVGFPPGDVSVSDLPEVSVAEGVITTVRRDRHEDIEAIEVDGGITQMYSGGPVVTQDGRLVGIAVAGTEGTKGHVIAGQRLKQTLAGRVTNVTLGTIERGTAQHRYRVIVELLDPLEVVSRAVVLTCPADTWQSAEALADGSWPRAADEMSETYLQIGRRYSRGTTASGDFSTPAVDTVFQVMLVRQDGTRWYSQPMTLVPVPN